MEKILKRALACALGSLLAFNGVSLPFSASDLFTRGITATKAETDVPFDSGYLDDESLMYEQYKLLPINSVLNMTKEQGQQKFKLRDLYLASFLFNDGSLITVPSLEIGYTIIDDKDKNTEDNISHLKYGNAILQSDFKKLINDDNIYGRFSNTDAAYLSLDPASKSLMIIEPLTHESHLNPDFFKRIFMNDPELKVSKIKEYSFEEYLSKYLRIKDLEQVGINPEDFEEEITLEEFRDKYYLKFVKEIDLPIEHNSTYPNPSIPKLKQEFLDLDLTTQKGIVLAEVASGRDTEKILICRYESAKCYDFFTDEEIKFENNSSKLKSDGLDGQITKGVFIGLNIEFWKPRSIDFNISIREGREYLYQLLGAAKQMKTIGDLIKAYQKIPLEYQIDYSYFDFSKSPVIEHMDPVWLADRPTPVPTPTPTPPPYAELRLGSRGQEVLDMKQRFFELGYFRTDQFSDQFNANTADTVKQFEKNNGLPVDGVADAVMLGVLFSDSAVGK